MSLEKVVDTERTRDLYEQIDGYPKPPLVPLPDPKDLSDFEHSEFVRGRASWQLLKVALVLGGFRSFQEKLPHTVENHLRRTNTRGPVLFAPVVSATMALDDDPRGLSPIARAATLLLAAFRLYRDIFSAKLPPDRHRNQVLEMGQYPNLFGTNIAVDGKKPRLFKTANDGYVVVAVAGRFYKLHIASVANTQEIADAIASIAGRAHAYRRRHDDPSPGVLTGASHRTQRQAFRKLRRDPLNAESLQAMKHNFLTLCLDLDDYPTSYAEAARVAHSLNYNNRWHHSSLQLVVFGNGKACAICDFNAYLDGNTMARAGAELWKRGSECSPPADEGRSRVGHAEPVELRWRVDRRMAEKARRDLRSVQDAQQATFTIDGVGKDLFSQHGVDPVAAFTLALQVAVKRLTGCTPQVEQFLTMSRYRCMGLTSADVSTPEAVQFIEYVEGPTIERGRALELLHRAVDSQIERCRRERRVLPPSKRLALFGNSRKGAQKLLAATVVLPTMVLLQLLGRGREIVLSHPTVYPGVPVFGRPGIRLPYVKYFGLHFQVLDKSVPLTLMPGVRWPVPNTEVVTVLRHSLEKLRSILTSDEQPSEPKR